MTNTVLYQCRLSIGISVSEDKRMKRRRGEADKEAGQKSGPRKKERKRKKRDN